jgi:hypothetical protein
VAPRPRATPWVPLFHRWVCHLVSQRARPGSAPYVPGSSTGLSAGGADALRCSQQPPGRVPERQ